MVDYNNSENASSLIGMLKQGGGLVNIEDEQTITGTKVFKDDMIVEPSVSGYGRLIFQSKTTEISNLETGWYRVGEYNTYSLNSIIWLSTRYSSYLPLVAQVSIIDNVDNIQFSLLNSTHSVSNTAQMSKIRVKTDSSTGNVQPRYICLYINKSAQQCDVLISEFNSSRYAYITWYDAPVKDTDIEGYTNYDLDLVRST